MAGSFDQERSALAVYHTDLRTPRDVPHPAASVCVCVQNGHQSMFSVKGGCALGN